MSAKGLSIGWIDVTVTIHSGMVHWPDNPPVRIEPQLSMARGDVCNVSNLAMGSHTGTHMDAPHHFVQGGVGIDAMPLDATIGRARIIEIIDPESIKAAEIEGQNIQAGERILFKTRNSGRVWRTDEFVKDFVYVAHDAAQYLADRHVRTVGVDYLSVGGFYHDGVTTHRALLGAGIWVIEGLNLSEVGAGDYDLICLPIKIRDGDGAPARALIRPI